MTIWDIINPWGALRSERKHGNYEASGYILFIRELQRKIRDKETEVEDLDKQRKELFLKVLSVNEEATRLRALVSTGHFRNPATGRLGKRGETFE